MYGAYGGYVADHDDDDASSGSKVAVAVVMGGGGGSRFGSTGCLTCT